MLQNTSLAFWTCGAMLVKSVGTKLFLISWPTAAGGYPAHWVHLDGPVQGCCRDVGQGSLGLPDPQWTMLMQTCLWQRYSGVTGIYFLALWVLVGKFDTRPTSLRWSHDNRSSRREMPAWPQSLTGSNTGYCFSLLGEQLTHWIWKTTHR